MRLDRIAEDRNFLDFLVPAVRQLALEAPVELALGRQLIVSGCRPALLAEHCGATPEGCDLVVIGADAKIPGRREEISSRQKARSLLELCRLPEEMACPAVAYPSVEAWLLSDPRALEEGLSEALGMGFAMPREWPKPRTELEAKRALSTVVSRGLGGPLPRAGFECADVIVPRMRLVDSKDEALAEWARDLVSRLRRGGRA